MAEPLVNLVRQGPVAVVSLNRPERHNALVPQLLVALIEALADQRCRDAVAVVLRAEGRSFSTGGDLLGFQQHRATIRDYAHEVVGLLNRAILDIYRHPVPVVCSVNGQVTGGSLGFLLASDRVVMQRGVSITPWYAEVGFSPDGGWTAMLPAIIGRQQSMHWLASNASLDADTCLDLGLVQEVVEDDCDAAALKWVTGLAKMQSASITNIRHLLNNKYNEIQCKLEVEREVFVKQVQSPQAQQGIDRFLRRN